VAATARHLGTVLSDSYAHLETAIGGSVGVSNVVPSAAEGEPVVAVAVPFETPQGRRVFSGAFAAEGTPLGSYFHVRGPDERREGVPARRPDRPIVNGASDGGDLPPELGPEQLAGMRDGFSEATVDGVTYAYSRAPVAGTPWHAVLVTPSDALYAPLDTGGWRSAALLVALAAASLAGFVGLVALARARVGAATSASAFGEQAVMLRSVIANNHSLISVKDLDGRYLLANEAFQQAHGITEEQLLGRTDEVVDPALASVWRANDERARSGLVQVEEWSHAADGRRTYESMKFPLHDGAGTVYATCGVSLDVTDLRHYVRAMESPGTPPSPQPSPRATSRRRPPTSCGRRPPPSSATSRRCSRPGTWTRRTGSTWRWPAATPGASASSSTTSWSSGRPTWGRR
jgi:PAS domain S-box-containing protein